MSNTSRMSDVGANPAWEPAIWRRTRPHRARSSPKTTVGRPGAVSRVREEGTRWRRRRPLTEAYPIAPLLTTVLPAVPIARPDV
ncbi:hypothetical protein MILUP08_42855 [Micromonospora lupini str. Lupac 08]|uniref:Uncharacterized protein n=1 Tax=Micromonospora lupini str. Lupac 08 TaxID=1150864 RepID=I0L277_9ACTN|nr:hypothetical protein MILUP08_42855 [Micromonospora lupini str. Lupac 08]